MAQRHPTKADQPAEGPTISLPNVVGFEPTPPPPERHERVRELRVEAFPTRANRDEMLRTYATSAPEAEAAGGQDHSAKAMVALRQARDGATARAKALGDQLRVSEDTIYELNQNFELAQLERDLAIQRLIASQGECRALREALDTTLRMHSMPPTLAVVTEDSADGVEGDGNGADSFPTERERLQAELDEVRTRSEIQIGALQAKLAASAPKRDVVAAEDELEWHRREVAALQGELEAAREQIRLISIAAPPAELSAPEPEADPHAVTFGCALQSPLELGRDHLEIERMLAELRADTSRVELLDQLAESFRESSGNAVAAGFPAVYRLTKACVDVVAWLRKTPSKIAGSMALLDETCALLRQLFDSGAAGSIADPAGASVYAVDNDEDNCECLVMALEKAALLTRYATKAEVAFGELSETDVDLIVLDVDLGDSDGFNLHDLIRQIEHHENTPVIFVSGLLSTADRLAGLTGPPASFVPKPYNLNELLLKALCTVVSSRLRQIAA